MKFDMAVKMFAEKHDITDSIQLQAIQLVMEGLPYNQIAEILGFKSKNCERIIRNILTKVGLNRPHARYEIMSEIYQISKGISEMDTLQK